MLTTIRFALGQVIRAMLGPAADVGRQIPDRDTSLVMTDRDRARAGMGPDLPLPDGARRVGTLVVIDGGRGATSDIRADKARAGLAVGEFGDDQLSTNIPAGYRQIS